MLGRSKIERLLLLVEVQEVHTCLHVNHAVGSLLTCLSVYPAACTAAVQVASTAGGARHLVAKGHLDRLLVAAGGGEGSEAEAPDPLLGASALRTLAKVLAKAEGVGLDVSVWLLFSYRTPASRPEAIAVRRRKASLLCAV